LKPNPTKQEFINQMLLSEVLITAIVFFGVYLIYKNMRKKQEAEDAAKKKGDKPNP
jgi:large-conductance mechanosensitive channel